MATKKSATKKPAKKFYGSKSFLESVKKRKKALDRVSKKKTAKSSRKA